MLKAFDILTVNVSRKVHTIPNCGYKLYSRCLSTMKKDVFKADLDTIFSEKNKVNVQGKFKNLSSPRSAKPKEGAKLASVLIPMCTVNGEPSLLYMVRPMTMLQHRGEVCFPGGKADEDDHDIVHTALREAEEEIGLPENKVNVWGQMIPIPSRDGKLNVIPVVGMCGEIDVHAFSLNHHEAESVFTRSIESLCCNVHSTQYRRNVNTVGGYTLPVFPGEPHRIWGLTAIFTHQLLHILIPELYRFKLIHR